MSATDAHFPPLPAPMAAFIGLSIPVLLRPEHALYRPINAFILKRPTLDLQGLPLFYDLFFSAHAPGLEFRQHRTWMLRLLSKSLQQHANVAVFQRSDTFFSLSLFL
jgi:hypothetical protein